MEKAEKVYISIVVVLCDMEMQSTSTPMNSRGQGHSVHCLSTFSKGFSSETTRPQAKGIRKFDLSCPYMVNTLKRFFFRTAGLILKS